MKKRYIISIAGAIGASAAAYILANKDKSEGDFNADSQEINIKNAGIPGQYLEENGPEQMENAKMVSEGSQFGVHYFNETNYNI